LTLVAAEQPKQKRLVYPSVGLTWTFRREHGTAPSPRAGGGSGTGGPPSGRAADLARTRHPRPPFAEGGVPSRVPSLHDPKKPAVTTLTQDRWGHSVCLCPPTRPTTTRSAGSWPTAGSASARHACTRT